MTGRTRGRPGKAAGELSKAVIIDAALDRLKRQPGATLSLRALATDLNVTPMALYNHIEGIDDVLRATAKRAFGAPPRLPALAPMEAIEALLAWYCRRVLAHPGLTTALIVRSGALPRPHAALTEQIRRQVGAAGLQADWTDMLIDHLHGYALSIAAGGPVQEDAVLATYQRQLGLLLSAAQTVSQG